MQSKSIHPLTWITGIAVILFSVAGIAAIMGWIPTSMGKTADIAAVEQASTNTSTQHAAKPAVAKTHTAPTQVAANVPAKARCYECGVVENVQESAHKGEGSGMGAVGGAVVGGLLGHQIGNGNGNTAATVIGAVGGGLAGNEVEKRVKSTKNYATTVRLDDGSSRVFNTAAAPGWHSGDKVKVVNDVLQSNI
ncbi:MAG: glycine zipper protein [Betaproteobacteria bacterium]|nr:glycine zipper protein [Betaproteobacteria bacterium]